MAIFNIDSWELTNDIKNNYDSILTEYHSCFAGLKPKFTTSFNENLHEGELNFLGIKMDTDLWIEQEKKFFTVNFENKLALNLSLSPVSEKIIKNHPMIRQWFWHNLGPGAEVTKHYGVNGINVKRVPDHYRLQYCFVPGEESFFYTLAKKIQYEKNTCFGFEDGMDLHWVKNLGQKNRLVLIVDIWKNMAPPIEFDTI
jgi:aspartyl/asparaginyl beta-hydroxylase (cupin superfamily)